MGGREKGRKTKASVLKVCSVLGSDALSHWTATTPPGGKGCEVPHFTGVKTEALKDVQQKVVKACTEPSTSGFKASCRSGMNELVSRMNECVDM